MNGIKSIEDIYPLTIVSTYQGRFVIINQESDHPCVSLLEGDEDYQYHFKELMKWDWEDVNYGVGLTISEAFEDFKINKV